ncbi:MAG: hypothetical protein KAI24_24845, partial [Planctomycetes bacterium]|nr:hypothetical protein [Planctomycetota bacterium]
MRILLLITTLVTAAPASTQAPSPTPGRGASALLDPMQTLSNATSGLRTAIADRDRAAIGDHLDAIEAALPSLAKAAAK